MSKLLITKGLPGSGKSFWAAKQAGFVVVCKDDIRKDLEKTGWKWSQENEKDVIRVQEEMIEALLKQGDSVIASDTNFGKHEDRLSRVARAAGADFAVRDFTDVPLQTCIERDAARVDGKVGDRVIRDMWHRYIETQLKPIPAVYVPGLPTCVICDLDGTLAIHQGRSPYDTAKCGSDSLNQNVQTVLLAMQNAGHTIIFVSGREDKFRGETHLWLTRHGWAYNKLLMRAAGDHRNDAIVKNEIFDQNIRGKWNVVCVLDDRDRVVQRWRDLGLACFQVNYGAF